MSKTTDHKARAELLARQFNARLAAEGLSVKARRDRRALAREAKAEATARRQMWDLRRRPGYASAEARRPFEPEVRLIRRADSPDATRTGTASAPPPKPSFAEMRAEQRQYPDLPQEVHDHKRRKREQKRTAARVRKMSDRDCKKN